MALERAARAFDPIAHTSQEGWGTALAILGCVVGAVIVVATAPVSIPTLAAGVMFAAGATATVATTTGLGAGIGQLIGSSESNTDPTAGYITDGAATVFTGEGLPEAARMSDPVDCHAEKKIAEGSDSVFIEGWNASRKGDETWCDGKISDGCPTVLIGGNAIGQAGSEDRSELSQGYRVTMKIVDWAGTIASFGGKKALKEFIVPTVGFLVSAYSETDLPFHEEVGAYGGTAVTIAGILTGKPRSEWGAQDIADNAAGLLGGANKVYGAATADGPPRTYGDAANRPGAPASAR